MAELLAADLVSALRCAAAASPDYGATMIEAADEIERLRGAIYQACSDMGCFCDEWASGECPMCQLEKKLRLQSDVGAPHAND